MALHAQKSYWSRSSAGKFILQVLKIDLDLNLFLSQQIVSCNCEKIDALPCSLHYRQKCARGVIVLMSRGWGQIEMFELSKVDVTIPVKDNKWQFSLQEKIDLR